MASAREDTMPLVENRTKLKLKNNELALGFGVHHLRTGATAMLAAAADHDWLFIDMEHGAHSVHEAAQLCIAALPTGVTPIVRICAGALDEGTRALDNGALGVIVPHVDTAERAQEIARAFRYPPLGTRSWGGPPAPYGFRAPGNAEAQAALNEAVLLVAMIESPQAVGNAEAIAAVEGIDCLLIGTSDLTAEMGIPGQIDHPRVVEAYEKVGAACRASGKALEWAASTTRRPRAATSRLAPAWCCRGRITPICWQARPRARQSCAGRCEARASAARMYRVPIQQRQCQRLADDHHGVRHSRRRGHRRDARRHDHPWHSVGTAVHLAKPRHRL
jgi:2-keto-3-deoxy-L-rhamnonate aldolase RhmA